jgi:hypothetical protein
MCIVDIACLVLLKTGTHSSIQAAEIFLRNYFEKEFPNKNFSKWNKTIPSSFEDMMKKVYSNRTGSNVSLLITDLESVAATFPSPPIGSPV